MNPAHNRITSPSARRPPRGGGFTLVEIMAVATVTAIIAAVAIPSLATIPATRRAAAARSIARDLTLARERAIATGAAHWAVFDAAAETYSILAEDPDNPGRAAAAILADPASGHPWTRTLGAAESAGVSIISVSFDAAAEVGFDWLGRPLNATEAALAAEGTIAITGGHTILVEPGTGLVSRTP